MNSWIHIAIWAAIIGAVFAYLWWQGQIRRLSDYCRETWVELEKCAWPTWEELKGQTVLIAICIALLGAFTVVADLILNFIFFKF